MGLSRVAYSNQVRGHLLKGEEILAKHRAQLIWDGGYLRIASVDFHPPDKNQAAEPELSKR